MWDYISEGSVSISRCNLLITVTYNSHFEVHLTKTIVIIRHYPGQVYKQCNY